MSTASGTQGVSVTGGMPGTTDLDSWRSIVALLWLGFVGLATFQLIPLLTGQMVDVYGFGDAQAAVEPAGVSSNLPVAAIAGT